MSTLSITKDYNTGEPVYEADLDAMKSSIETFVNTTKINDDNIRDSGITASTKILDSSVTTAKLGSECIETAKIADDAITTAKIADGAVGTDAIAANAVTLAKLEAINYNRSSDVSTTVNNTSLVSVATVSITTTGRPVVVEWHPNSSGVSEISLAGSSQTTLNVNVQFKRDSTVIATYPVLIQHVLSASMHNFDFPASSYFTFDIPAAGTYTYSMHISTGSSVTATIKGRLLVYEVL